MSGPEEPPHLPDAVERLSRLIAFQSESLTSNADLIAWMASRLQTVGGRVVVLEGAPGRSNLLASFGPEGVGGVLLSGHSDVVPPGEGWTTNPYHLVVDGERLVGRGTADMKGFLAVLLAVLEQADLGRLVQPLHVAVSYDEEIGCVGVRGLLEHLSRSPNVRPDLVVVGEPTSMHLRDAHRGKVAFRVEITGRPAHSSRSHLEPSAIDVAVELVAAVGRIGRRSGAEIDRNTPSVTTNVGTIAGGVSLNVIAPFCTFEFEVRHDANVDPDAELEPFWTAVAEAHDAFRPVGGGVAATEVARYPALASDPADPFVRMAQEWASNRAAPGLGYGTEGGLFQQILQAPVVVCGPGDIAVAHAPDEYVTIGQLDECRVFLGRILAHLSR